MMIDEGKIITQIEFSEKKANAFLIRLQLKKKLRPDLKDALKRTYNCHWSDNDKAFSGPQENKILVEAFLKGQGINFALEDAYDEYFNLNSNQQKQNLLLNVKAIKTSQGLNQVIQFQKLLDDYNNLWGENLKTKNLSSNSFEERIQNIANDKQKEHLAILFKEFQKVGRVREEIKEIEEKIEDSLDELDIDFKLNLHVLGFNSQRQILIWHKGKIIPIPTSQLKADDLKLFVGCLPVSDDKAKDPYAKIKNEIIKLAHERGLIDEEEPLRSGLWKIKDQWLIISGRQAAIIKDKEFKLLEAPVIDDKVIQFERSKWIDLEILEKFIKNQEADLSVAFEKLKNLISQWCWVDPTMIEYVTAFLMLQLFQSVMRWRPWIYLLGAAGSGKTTFLDFVIERLFGSLVKRLDKSTGHAIAQALGGNGKIPIFDEFEKHKHMSSVLENLKLSNRGGTVSVGTPGECPKEFNLSHLPWLSSIYLPKSFSSDQAQLSRVVKFELKKVPEGKSVTGLSDDEAQNLLCEIITSVMFRWEEIEEGAYAIEKMKSEYIKEYEGKISGRTVENLMYAMSLLNLVKNETQRIPNWMINEIKDDGENILESIVMSKIRLGTSEYFVFELINKVLGEPIDVDICEVTAKDLLRKHGLSVVRKPIGWFLAIRAKDVSEHLFKFNSDYKGLDIKAPLERLDGVEKSVKTEWGGQDKLRAMHIPGRHINAIISD